ncbi:MAG: HAMP domain-containing sensor histidine kinase [Rhodoferax sp.]
MTPIHRWVHAHHERWHTRARRALAYSLRLRLLVLFFLLAAALVAIFLFGMQRALGIGWRDAARPLVADYVDRLAAEVGTPPSIERAQALVSRLPLTVRISGPVVNWRSEGAAQDYPAGVREWEREGGGWRPFERRTADGHLIRFGLNVQAWHDRPRYIGLVTLAVLLALIALAYARLRHMLRPIEDIRAGAQRFGRGDFGQPIAVRHPRHPDELGELAATINTMGADIHQMLEAKRALLLAISHELRSPLTRARLNTELLPETPEVQPSRQALLRDLALMRDLVTDLLESERLASRHAALQRETVEPAALLHEVLQALGERAASVHTQVAPGVGPCALDPARVRLLLRNLIDNALRHTPPGAAPPQVDVALQDGALCVQVRDFGPGVAPEQLDQLGQPFFRPDAARSRDSGGVGLGLYLCRLVAQAHGGSFTVRNAQPGLEVVVTLRVELADA